MPPAEPDTCRYRLDTDSSATLVLPDGRKLGYAEYGAPTGQPILYQHGFPGARLEVAPLDQVASKVGARLIAIDRPGFGWSSPHKNRTFLSHAQDVEALANHLKLKHYGVLGVSGGGPYALACARFLPADKLRAVSLVCGLGSPDMGYWGMRWPNYLGWTFGQRMFPGLCRWWFGREPGARLDLSDEERLARLRQAFEKDKASMHPKDRAVLGDVDFMRVHLRTAGEAYGQGMDGFSLDFKVLNSNFGFRIEDIRKDLPIHLWYGRLDTNVPLQHGEKIAVRVGSNARLIVEEDETHASIWANFKEEYLGELVTAIKA
ncbi:hypothetical protein LTR70_002425 [Exophiala xenobiotica]|uniref:AB hydrolase-1 domain-containing protein n=1 Tax=Lithohypha guttulata TaxID=1690604 RepID=A0ABR0KKV2_9EURO|nr:hypothetical protein LTR24_001422 [Lithohypha guttulata]KAK5325453.1 hypothetical protein LTR70_002425 [Exophiala xenobiotica]